MHIRWTKTLEGESLTFPGRRIIAGETCELDDAEGALAIRDELATPVEPEKRAAKEASTSKRIPVTPDGEE